MRIKFYDDEELDYPLISICKEDFEKFKGILEKYQKEKMYNFDDFLGLLRANDINVKELGEDIQLFF